MSVLSLIFSVQHFWCRERAKIHEQKVLVACHQGFVEVFFRRSLAVAGLGPKQTFGFVKGVEWKA